MCPPELSMIYNLPERWQRKSKIIGLNPGLDTFLLSWKIRTNLKLFRFEMLILFYLTFCYFFLFNSEVIIQLFVIL